MLDALRSASARGDDYPDGDDQRTGELAELVVLVPWQSHAARESAEVAGGEDQRADDREWPADAPAKTPSSAVQLGTALRPQLPAQPPIEVRLTSARPAHPLLLSYNYAP